MKEEPDETHAREEGETGRKRGRRRGEKERVQEEERGTEGKERERGGRERGGAEKKIELGSVFYCCTVELVQQVRARERPKQHGSSEKVFQVAFQNFLLEEKFYTIFYTLEKNIFQFLGELSQI